MRNKAMKITRRFTKEGQNPFDTVEWTRRSSKISNPDGSVVFEMDDAEVPKTWSQLATDIMVSKYFRKAGVPQDGGPNGLPSPGYERRAGVPDGEVEKGPEKSAKQVIHRLAGCWRHWGEKYGYFDTPADAQAFYDELVYMMVHQMCAPNSPQWFNTGLHWAYGITGPAQGHYYCDPVTGECRLAEDAYSHPQPHACFIQSIDDDLVNEGGIMDLWTREARLFKYGSGTGTNFSRLRAEGEPLSGGGKSSGLMSWLKIGDRAAAAIKSGGTTRRAAKMVCLDLDHPDIVAFINWKVREEIKVAAMVEGFRAIAGQKASIHDSETIGQTARRLGLTLDYDFNGEAYQTVSGQNSNNSIRIPDAFFEAVDRGTTWRTYWRTTGEVARTYDARELWDQIGYAAWRCADPGVQFDSTINAWHTCPNAGRINASNPCSEYMFIDNTACNLASLNVLKFYDPELRSFDVGAFEHAIDLWTIVLEISVLMAAFPSRQIAELSYRYRTLGLGYANLGAMLMQAGIPYDSDEARAVCACVSAVLTGRSYRMSALMAKQLGAFPGYEADRSNMLRVIRQHRLAAHGTHRSASEYGDLKIRPVPIDHALIRSGRVRIANIENMLTHATHVWDEALSLGIEYGYRNAQTTVIAPTGTIGLLMDCDTTGVEPDFALVKFKKLAGGGYFKIANASLRPALKSLGYTGEQIREILQYILGTLDLSVPMPTSIVGVQEGQTFAQWLIGKGFEPEDLENIQNQLPGVFELSFAFAPWALSDETLKRVGIDPAEARVTPGFNVLKELGLDARSIEELNTLVCGTQTIEGAPHVRAEHLPVFDCANKCGRIGQRYIRPEGHIRMMAAAQPFISGAISKTINLPHEATVDDIKAAYRLSWELGLKANALYRDRCKLSQPLNTSSDVDLDEEVDEAGESEAREEVAEAVGQAAMAAASEDVARVERIVEKIEQRPMRRRLPETRQSLTHKFNVAGHEGYLTVGLYEDGKPGELFITMAKEGSTIGGLMDSLGTATSVALQYGVPLESLVRKFTHQRFEPAGMTTNRDIPFARSLVDYIFRWLGMQFIPGFREANAPQRSSESRGSEAGPQTDHKTMHTKQKGASRWNANEHLSDQDETPAPSNAASRSPRSEKGTTDARPGGQAARAQTSTLSMALESMEASGDAPPCDVCGEITVRSGTCYKCMNCGNSMGCS
ncbi:MAG: vitamin B12-dependent ribonucleotide reductase [Phycisphaerales bacterium]